MDQKTIIDRIKLDGITSDCKREIYDKRNRPESELRNGLILLSIFQDLLNEAD